MLKTRLGTRSDDGRPRRRPGRHRQRTPHGPLSTRHSLRNAAAAVATGGWPISPSRLRGVLVRRSPLLVVCLAVFVDMVGFGIILPVLPFHAARLGGSGVWVGALLTAYAVAQFVSAPILGALSDRYGRRRLLLLSLAGSAVSLALTGLAGSLFLLLLARVVAGAFGGAVAVGQAYAVDLAAAKDRTRALGLVGASIGLGFVFGPALGAALAALGLGLTGVSLVAAALATANLVAGARLLPPSAEHRPTPSVDARHSAEEPAALDAPIARLASLNDALRRRALRPILLAIFAAMFAFASMETTLALLGERRFGFGPAGLGVVFASVGAVMAIVQGTMVGRLTDRYGDRTVAVAGAVAVAVPLALLPFVPAWTAYLALLVLAVGQGLLSTTTAVLIAGSGEHDLGGAFGVGQSAAAAARAVGPLVAGAAYDLGAALPYVGGAVLCLAAAGLLAQRAPLPSARTA